MRHCKTARGQFFQIGALENHPVGASMLIGLHAHKNFLDKLVPGGPGQEDVTDLQMGRKLQLDRREHESLPR